VLEGDVADPSHLPAGCHFHPRCRYATDRCRIETPELREVAPGHAVRCLRATELSLLGVAAQA
jgi:oligopeptide/dipeptide ABC transporter ATP-binding protein